MIPVQGFIQRKSFWGGSSRKWVWLYILFYTTVTNLGGGGGGGGGGEASPPLDETLNSQQNNVN